MPPSTEPSTNEEVSKLQDRLDGLWTSYLEAVDQYVAGQEELSKTLASGYFALAQANARRTGGRWYGRDWYDQRTKATIKATVTVEVDAKLPILGIQEVPVYLDADPTETAEEASPVQLPTPAATPEPSSEESEKVPPRKRQPDPATWYGLFVSPSLRSAQSRFRDAVLGAMDYDGDSPSENALVTALNSSRQMRAIEVDIRATRKAVRAALRKMEQDQNETIPLIDSP